MNPMRSQLSEFGIIAAKGNRGFAELVALIEAGDRRIPSLLLAAFRTLNVQVEALKKAIDELENKILAIAKADPIMRRLATIPGVGGLTAHAIVAAVGDGKLFALGASTIMRNAKARTDRATEWQRGILARRPMKVSVLAQAAKTAPIAWAILTSGESFKPHPGASRSLATAQ